MNCLAFRPSFCLKEVRLCDRILSDFVTSSVVGIFQSEHLLSYTNMSSVGSLRSAVISRFLTTVDPSDSQRCRMTAIYSCYPLATLLPPHWVSQIPRLIYPRALSPTTPGGPMAASARFFTIAGGLHHSSARWPLPICVTRLNRVHSRYGSRVRSAGLRPFGLLLGPLAPLLAERAINRVTPFQVTRSARLSLAHRSCKLSSMIWPMLRPCRAAVFLIARCRLSSRVMVSRLIVAPYFE